MSTKIVDANEPNIRHAAKLLRAGELVAFPTETVYGLGADACNAAAISQIFAAKGRPANDPLIVHLAKTDQIEEVAELTSKLRDRLTKLTQFWPGPLSVILPKRASIPDTVTAGLSTVAVRIPRHPVALALLEEADRPIAAPSANPFAYVSPTCAEHVARILDERVELILNGGACEVGLESTVISISSEPVRVLRPGGVALEALRELFPDIILESRKQSSNQPFEAPGMSLKHYSPKTPVVLRNGTESLDPRQRFGYISFKADYEPLVPDPKHTITLSDTGVLSEVSKNLFSALHDMDARDLDFILVDSCHEEGLGIAIMDRLRRAIQN